MSETIFVASGEVPEERHEEILRTLTEFGLSAHVITDYIPNSGNSNTESSNYELPSHYDLNEIVSSEQYIGKEHLHQLAKQYVPHLHKRDVTKAFSFLVTPRAKAKKTKSWSGVGERIPSEVTRLVIKTREGIDFPTLPKKYGSDVVDN